MCLISCRVMRKAVIVMSKTTFEKLGIPYEERDGIFYPVIVAGTEYEGFTKRTFKTGLYHPMFVEA